MQLVTDPLMEELQKAIRFTLTRAKQSSPWKELVEQGFLGFECPLEKGGYGLGIRPVLTGCEALGISASSSFCIDWLAAIDLLFTFKTEVGDAVLSSAMDGQTKIGLLIAGTGAPQDFDRYIDDAEGVDYWILALKRDATWFAFLVPGNEFHLFYEDVSENRVMMDEKYWLTEISEDDEHWQTWISRRYLRQAAYLLGISKGAHREAVQYVNKRRQFGKKVIENQVVSNQLAVIYGQMEALLTKLSHAALLHDANKEAHQCMLYATELLAGASECVLEVTKSCIHFHGAYGLTKKAPIERYYRLAALEAVRLETPFSLWMQSSAIRTHYAIINHL